MHNFTAIVTCKGRLQHLQQTLPLLCDLADTEVVLVDYDCPDACGEWSRSNFPKVQVVTVRDDSGFNVSRARNLGAKIAKTDYLFFVDADVKVLSGCLIRIKELLNPNSFIRAESKSEVLQNDIRGTCVIPRNKFILVGGYDEVLRNYGMEDTELYQRMLDNGLEEKLISDKNFDVIKHSDELRTRFLSSDAKDELILVSNFYRTYVRALRDTMRVPQLEMHLRQQIYTRTHNLIKQLRQHRDQSGGIRFGTKLKVPFPKDKQISDMDWQLELILHMKPK